MHNALSDAAIADIANIHNLENCLSFQQVPGVIGDTFHFPQDTPVKIYFQISQQMMALVWLVQKKPLRI